MTPENQVKQEWSANTTMNGNKSLNSPEELLTNGAHSKSIKELADLREQYSGKWNAINPESVARMRAQNRFKTGIDIAKYTSAIMRADMDAYDNDPTKYTQSLGCWHGFIGQQKMISIKKHFGTNKRNYLYLSGWMVAALRSEFGPLPDQSMHEKNVCCQFSK